MEKVKEIWFDLLHSFNADKVLTTKFWQQIKSSYSEKGRYYHTLSHVLQMLDLSTKHSDKLQDINNLQFSIFYHDIIYSATKGDNEERSADLAAVHLSQLNFSTEKIEKCKLYILATKSHLNPSKDPDLDYFLDFDLEKLGAPWPDYEEYTKQIRKEYKIYPKPIYNKGRKKVLEHFLAMEKIYKTAIFVEHYERQARENLKKELLLFQ